MANSVDVMINIQQKMTGANAVTQLQAISQAITQEESALKNLVAWQKRMQKSSSVDVAEYQRVTALIQQKNDNLAGLAETLVKVGEAQDDVAKKPFDIDIGAAAKDAGTLADGIGQLPGPIGAAGQKFKGLSEGFQKLKSMGMAGVFVGLAAVVAVVTIAFIAGVAALTKYAISAASAKRMLVLQTEAMVGSSKAARGLVGAYDAIEASTGVGAERLQDLTRQLKDAKVPAQDLPKALRALATAEAALGQEGAAKFFDEIKEGKKTVDQVSNEIQSKFGGLVEEMMLDPQQQFDGFKKKLSKLFADIDIKPFLNALKDVLKIFDQSTASGRALKFLAETMFQPLINSTSTLGPLVKRFFQGMIIAALQFYIILKPTVDKVLELFDIDASDNLETALRAGEFAMKGFAVALAVVVGLVAALQIPLAVVGAAFYYGIIKPGMLIWSVLLMVNDGVNAAKSAIWGFVSEAASSFGGMVSDLAGLGVDMMVGLAKGIVSGGGKVLGAISDVIGGAIGKARSLLDSHSPSRVMASLGVDTGDGYVDGVERTTGAAQAAMADLVAPPSAPSGSVTTSSVGGAVTINVYVDGASASDDDGLGYIIARKVAELFANGALSAGAAPEPA